MSSDAPVFYFPIPEGKTLKDITLADGKTPFVFTFDFFLEQIWRDDRWKQDKAWSESCVRLMDLFEDKRAGEWVSLIADDYQRLVQVARAFRANDAQPFFQKPGLRMIHTINMATNAKPEAPKAPELPPADAAPEPKALPEHEHDSACAH